MSRDPEILHNEVMRVLQDILKELRRQNGPEIDLSEYRSARRTLAEKMKDQGKAQEQGDK